MENGFSGFSVASHVLHKVMTRAFHGERADSIRTCAGASPDGEKGERARPPDCTLYGFSWGKINGNNGDTHGSVRL